MPEKSEAAGALTDIVLLAAISIKGLGGSGALSDPPDRAEKLEFFGMTIEQLDEAPPASLGG